jgi:hypothetical protein
VSESGKLVVVGMRKCRSAKILDESCAAGIFPLVEEKSLCIILLYRVTFVVEVVLVPIGYVVSNGKSELVHCVAGGE